MSSLRLCYKDKACFLTNTFPNYINKTKSVKTPYNIMETYLQENKLYYFIFIKENFRQLVNNLTIPH